jgi:hypothetical protein
MSDKRILTPEQLRDEWDRARTPEQLDRYLELVRERNAATQLVLEVCACCKGGFRRLPRGKRGAIGLCQSCQEHNARRAVADHLLSTLPGCIGVAACTISGTFDERRQVEVAGSEGYSASIVTALLAKSGWEHSQVRANKLLLEGVRRNKFIVGAVTSGSEIPRRMLEGGAERLEHHVSVVRQKCQAQR